MVTAHLRHTPEFASPPTMAQIERQIRWEGAAVEAGIKRYREELASPTMTLADTSPGQKIIRTIMADFVPWLADAQEVTKAGLVCGSGQPRDWTFLLLLLPPEHLAYLTLRSVMTERPKGTGGPQSRTLTSCARTLAAAIEQEVAFQSWVAEERDKRREARKLGKPYRDLYEALRRSTKVINGRMFRRWMARIERLWRQGWSEQDRFQLGCNLIKYMIDHGARYFELTTSRHSGKTQTYVTLTEQARVIIEDAHARAEVMCPAHRPMLCPRNPGVGSLHVRRRILPPLRQTR
jgi:DNA-directed RNA polymerase N-terminal